MTGVQTCALPILQLNIGEYKNRDQYLAESVAQVDRLAAMVNDVLHSGSVAEQALRQEKRLRIDKLIAEVVDDYTLLAKTRGMTFAVDARPTTIRANPDMIHHVISNLVSNAVRHGDAGRVIKITCDQRELAIENACKPLTKQQLQHIFDPFYRSNAATKQHTDSSGIGLYTVKMLLDTKGLYEERFISSIFGACIRSATAILYEEIPSLRATVKS